jgi:CheY-like chemotaxis protein
MRKRSKKNVKIMIVEDDEDNLTLYSDYLSKRGYHVIVRYTKGNNINTNLETHDKDRRDPYLFLNFVDSEYLNDFNDSVQDLFHICFDFCYLFNQSITIR